MYAEAVTKLREHDVLPPAGVKMGPWSAERRRRGRYERLAAELEHFGR